jgi:hypothetical protein
MPPDRPAAAEKIQAPANSAVVSLHHRDIGLKRPQRSRTMTRTLAAVKQTVVFAGAAAAISIGSIFVTAPAAHAAPLCSPQDAPCTTVLPQCSVRLFICDKLPPVLEDPPNPPKPPFNPCKLIDCHNIGEGQVLVEATPEPTQPPAGPQGGNDNPAPETTPPASNNNDPATGDTEASPRPVVVRAGTGSSPASGQVLAGTGTLPVGNAAQPAQSSGPGVPTFVWIVLSALLSAAGALMIARRRS